MKFHFSVAKNIRNVMLFVIDFEVNTMLMRRFITE